MRIDSYAQTPEGLLLMADGFSAVQVWDGLAATTFDAGNAAPTTAVTMAGSGNGNIVGTYYAYSRFVDSRDNVSDLSPISAVFVASAVGGTVTNASDETPIIITSAAPHGLSSGQQVSVTGVNGNTGANGSWAVTVLSATQFSLDGSAGDGNYVSAGTFTTGVLTLTYTNVPVPASSKIVRREILRNTDGQTDTFYVDVSTTDLVTTTFASTRADANLQVQEAVPIFNTDGTLFANAHGIPPAWKTSLSHHLGRMFLCGERAYADGMVSVTSGSATVTGINTAFLAVLVGRFLYIVGAPAAYEISAVDTTNQTLTLTTVYGGTTDQFSVYSIRPAPAERRLVYYSEANLPESWPATNAISIQEDGDELTGSFSMGSFLYILEKRHVYRFTFQTNPGIDGFVFLALSRGSANNRCCVVVEDTAYLLDQAGIYSFGGSEEADPISQTIKPIFQPQNNDQFKINWDAADLFHACHYPAEESIRWFVSMSGEKYPRHALALDYRQKRWWIEEYQRPIASSATANYQGHRRVFLGCDARTINLLGAGNLDGPAPAAGTTRSTVTSAGASSLTDTTASFPSSGLVGNPVSIVDGTGKGQTRTVISQSGTTLQVDRPWIIRPDSTSSYQLGGIPWQYKSPWYGYVESENQIATKLDISWQPVVQAQTLTLQILRDYSSEPALMASNRKGSVTDGFTAVAGSADLVLDLARPSGHAQQRMDRHREPDMDGQRRVAFTLSGQGGLDRLTIYRIYLDGIER